jgi:hypothetical protein
MKRKSARLSAVALVAVISVLGLSQGPADAKVVHHKAVAKITGGWCC